MRKRFYNASKKLMNYDNYNDCIKENKDLYELETSLITCPSDGYEMDFHQIKKNGNYITSSLLYYSKVLNVDLFKILLGESIGLDNTNEKLFKNLFTNDIKDKNDLFLRYYSVFRSSEWSKAFQKGKAIELTGAYIILYQDFYFQKPTLKVDLLKDIKIITHSFSGNYGYANVIEDELGLKSYDMYNSKLKTSDDLIPSHLKIIEDNYSDDYNKKILKTASLDRKLIIPSFTDVDISLLSEGNVDKMGEFIINNTLEYS